MTRLEKLLVLILGILVLVVGGTMLLLWMQPDPDAIPVASGNASAPSAVQGASTAHFAYATAIEAVKAWQTDAQLVNATATWPRGAQEADLEPGRATWNFTYFSPASGALTQASVLGDQVTLYETGTSAETPSLLGIGQWQQDSDSAVATFLDNGGREFLRQNGLTTLTLSLDMRADAGRAVWIAALFANSTGRSLTMQIDAASGDILSTEQME